MSAVETLHVADGVQHQRRADLVLEDGVGRQRRAAILAVGRQIAGVLVVLAAEEQDGVVAQAAGQQRTALEPTAPAAVVGRVVHPDIAAGHERAQRDVLVAAVEDLEAWSRRQVEQRDVGGRDLELAVGIGGELGLERRLVLMAEIPAMADLQRAHRAPVGRAEAGLVEAGRLAEQQHARPRRAEVGVGLVAPAEEDIAGQAGGAELAVDLGEILLGPAPHVRGHGRRPQRRLRGSCARPRTNPGESRARRARGAPAAGSG